METLAKIFGGEARVKIMRLFLFNQEALLDLATIAEKVKEDPTKVRKELVRMERFGLLKKKTQTRGGKQTHFFMLNRQFEYLLPLQNFLISSKPLQPKEIVKKITSLGSIKLILISGLFLQDSESRVDLLVVGDNIKKGQFDNMVTTLEAEIGKELKYAYFSTDDFNYRFSMYDKLIRDILDFPHEKLINKLPVLS